MVQDSLPDSNSKGKRQLFFTMMMAAALCASGAGGAWVHARFYSGPVMTPAQEHALISQASRDSAYIRENINVLADKVGALQAKVIAVSSLSRRVATAAGVQYTEPEIHASLTSDDPGRMDMSKPGDLEAGADVFADTGGQGSVMDLIETSDMPGGVAEGLGRRLDALYARLTAQEDGFALLDLLMTRRAGIDASLPSYNPVDYPYLSSSFGWRRNPVTGRHAMHDGLDFAAPSGAPIYAASGGVVTQARFRRGYGNLVEITHGNGLSTRYAHASSIKVKEGDLVEKGQTIALVGSTGRSTGAHLHFEVRMAGHPLDPTLFLAPQDTPEQLIASADEHASATGSRVR